MRTKTRKRFLILLLGGGTLLIAVAALLLGTVGCALMTPLPEPTTVSERLQAVPTDDLPITAPVTIYWDEHMIPFIEAESDEDLAFALGLVHAHLRLGQMVLYTRAVEGRLSEMFGPPLAKVDHALRILDLGRAAEEIEANLPDETRAWLEAYARGVNTCMTRMEDPPHEFKVGGVEPEPWTIRHTILLDRLLGVDINWMAYVSLLSMRGSPHYDEMYRTMRSTGDSSVPSFSVPPEEALLNEILVNHSRSGSNCFAVSSERSATGGAILAGDPHLGVSLPNTWLVVGCKSPSCEMVGLMFPGAPLMVIGRNRQIAWGGTNMRASTSDLYDVSGKPLRENETKIGVRWWFDRRATLRDSDVGPVVSDAPFIEMKDGPDIALRWVGHEPTDELTALLEANRARDWPSFRAAFKPYGVPGMNILYADVEGNIGQLSALRLPVRHPDRPDRLILDPDEPTHRWQGFLGPDTLPSALNPETGFLVSANNVPARTSPPLAYFSTSNDRLLRMRDLLARSDKLSMEQVKAIQRDVHSATDFALRNGLIERMDSLGLSDAFSRDHATWFAAFSEWDGDYAIDSRGAVAFQALLAQLMELFRQARFGESAPDMRSGIVRGWLEEAVRSGDDSALRPLIEQAVSPAADAFDDAGTWGDIHRLEVAHVFSSMPIVGGKYVFDDRPTRGSEQTVQKTAHETTVERHTTRYGSNSRHIFDMADPDENYFVLIGGQDGWLNSEAMLDQTDLWFKDEYIRVPLRIETVRETFPTVMTLTPR